MNLAAVDKIGKAVLYEGYMLYPYRPSSVKNQQRWNFGVLCPKSYSEQEKGTEPFVMRTECLVEATSGAELEVRVRFLQLVDRWIGELVSPFRDLQPEETPEIRKVPRIEVGGRVYQPWQEAVEREVILPVCHFAAQDETALSQTFELSSARQLEHLHDGDRRNVGVIVREQNALCGAVEVKTERLSDRSYKVGVWVRNLTPFSSVSADVSREVALLRSLVSTHVVLGIQDGQFCSQLDPPDHLRDAAAGCLNVGAWPVLIGEEGQRDTVLCSPIILYDYPQIAPESAGDLFDGTEIDEILSLRIMTLTDEEKREMSQSDDRARQMLERTESMPVEQLMKMHGVLRQLRPVKEEMQ